jgi:hypothetical protein
MRAVMSWSPAVSVPPAPVQARMPAPPSVALPSVASLTSGPPIAAPSGDARVGAPLTALAIAQRAVRQPAAVLSRRKPSLPADRMAESAFPPGYDDAVSRFAPSLPQGIDADAPPRADRVDALPPVPPRAFHAGWSLGGWLYLRGGEPGAVPDGLAAGGQIGGSQAGVRLEHGFGGTGRTRAYGRGVIATERPRQRELALGLAHAPFADVSFDVAVERRVAVGREGRDAFAAMVAGGVSEARLPAGFRLDVYAQAGVVGARRRDGFADGAIVVDRLLHGGPLRIGALAAGAVQPDAARVDVGPRLTLGLPALGQGARVALDWRQRVAGNARPDSGPSLTLAADF